MKTNPYTYLIGWSETNTYYFGVRYARGCDPSDLWVTYFTSSKGAVQRYRKKHGEPDVIKTWTHPDKETAIDKENEYLRSHIGKDGRNWLNRNVGGTPIHAIPHTDEAKEKISKSVSLKQKNKWRSKHYVSAWEEGMSKRFGKPIRYARQKKVKISELSPRQQLLRKREQRIAASKRMKEFYANRGRGGGTIIVDNQQPTRASIGSSCL